MQIIVEFTRAHSQREVHKHTVTTVLYALGKVLRAVTDASPAFDSLTVDHSVARAKECVAFAYRAAFYCRCGSKNLKSRARLVHVDNHRVFAVSVQHIHVVARNI